MENKEKAKQPPILGDALHPIAFAKDYLLLATTIRLSLTPRIDFEHPQALAKQLSLTHPYLELLQLPIKLSSVDQMFVRSSLKTLAVLRAKS